MGRERGKHEGDDKYVQHLVGKFQGKRPPPRPMHFEGVDWICLSPVRLWSRAVNMFVIYSVA
jgi:hypothetical protein